MTTTSLFCVVFLVGAASNAGPRFADAAEGNKLLVVLLDGFRWDYLETFFTPGELPGFTQIQNDGIRAKSLQPDFPSLSFVNYYSLMTGLHAENHGMIHNYMYDPPTGKYFLIGENPDQYLPLWWDDGEPLWVTAEKQSKRSYFWYWCGCEVEIRGVRPQFCQPYLSAPNPSFVNFSQAFDSAIEVLRNGSADVAGVYFEQVDQYGHDLGPGDSKLASIIRGIDAELNRVLNLLKTTNFLSDGKQLQERVNLMVFSDHGMTQLVDPISGIIHVDNVSFSSADIVVGSKFGPVVQVYVNPDRVDPVYNSLKNYHPNMTVYRKDEIPDRWRLKGHPRVPPLLLVADKGYAITNKTGEVTSTKGFHGYDNEIKDMDGIFLAIGPNFQKGKQVKALRSVDLYQIMCRILSITAAPNNGSWADVADFYVDPSGPSSFAVSPCAVSSLVLVILAAALATC